MAQFNIIPYPSSLRPKDGYFTLDGHTRLCPDQANQANAEVLQQLLQPATGYNLLIDPTAGSSKDSICLVLRDDLGHLGEEGYQLNINENSIQLLAQTTTGIFYAIQTVRQMLPAEIESRDVIPGREWKIPCAKIEDDPRFPWRGYMLDEGRHFQGIETVKKLLDQMALFKLNRFHWHLTDDQGWRIEINRYPLLTGIGGIRPGTVTGNPYLSNKHDQIPHGGFYTQDEIREVVDYASQRHIMVVPEIEMPGHSSAALAAYPQFSCTGGLNEIPTRWGIFPDIYCAGKPETYEFLENILSEVIDLFPSPYIHIGGDESPKKRWKECPDCQAKIAEKNLADEHALQVQLVNRIAGYLGKFGKRIIFWSDAFDPAIDPSAIVHYWIGKRRPILRSVEQGRELINSAYLSTYLDQSYVTIPLKKAQSFDPLFSALPEEAQSRVLGFESLMWGEYTHNYRRVEYQTFPRLLALAEGGWRKQSTSFDDHRKRLGALSERLDRLDIGYAPIESTNPPIWKQSLKFFDILRRKDKISLPVKEVDIYQNLNEVPLGLPGKVFRSPMPHARFDIENTTFEEYLDAGIKTVVMLVEEGEDFHYTGKNLKEEYSKHEMSVIQFPIRDFDTPEDGAALKETVLEVMARSKGGENVAVHCFAGRGRTGLFLAMLSRQVLGLEGQQAIDYVRQYFPAIETPEQEQMVREYKLDE